MGSQAMIFVILGLAFAAWVDCNLEGDILLAQKKAWKDPNNILQSWDPTKINPCTWLHITCNIDNSVIRIDLGAAGLSGPLIPQLGKLVNLQYIELYGNNINGTIPKELGNLKSLVSLDMQQNLLTGTIPSSLGNLKYLRFLRLSENMLTGNIPTEVLNLIRFGNFIVLNVSRNNMDGTVTGSKKTGFAISIVVQDQKAP